ncbi:universal stress protein [Pseudonocardia sp. N23]|uniref:universal stress protein n=1 Tax=Pseudonocardia sp. N23 TaxID=1987376 RepID=UPI000BFCEBFD|nr:universal stress protein [Pseudonocardia sp. N23]GAY07344.1 universal stress protein family [Pseudonocardia sp. N23]
MSCRPILLVADDMVSARWAAAEAERMHTRVQVVGTGDDVGRARTTRRLRALFPDASVSTCRVADPLGVDLERISTSAELLVVAAPPDPEVLLAAACPVAAVPLTVPPAGRVIVGVAPRTATAVLDIAVREAVSRDAELVAVRAWSSAESDLGRILPDTLERWDRDLARVRHDLERSVAPWRTGEPGRRIRLLTVRDDPAPLLVALAVDAELLVLGRSSNGAAAGTVAGASPSDLVAAARCPVLVVPEPVPGDGPGLAGHPAGAGRRSARSNRTGPSPS